jgi:two-component system, OmpR family, phosphate regulon sensor histidine kinase PhoR
MRNKNLLATSIVFFVLAQVTSAALLGLFIYRFFIARHLAGIMEGQFSITVDSIGSSIFLLVSGCLFYVAVSVALSIIFKNFTLQLRLTGMYDSFIANITHELKSPLASIQLYLETLKKRRVPEERQTEFIDQMLKDATRLKNLINSILKVAVLEKKKDIFECRVYAAEELVPQLFKEVLQQFKLPPETVSFRGNAPFDCVIDENALRVVFANLVDNAMKYSVEPLKLIVELSSDKKNIYIDFIDNGIGISSKEQKRVFQKFYRVEHSQVPNVKGTGLGLYWVREIIKLHGGTITVFSEGHNTGSTFKIELPIYQVSKTRYLNRLLKWAKQKNKKQDESDESQPV